MKLSPSALTNQISSLERSLDVKLFERSRRGAELTVVGRELLPRACRAVEEFRGLRDHAASMTQLVEQRFRIGMTRALGAYVLPLALPTLHRRYNELRLTVREDECGALEEGLIQGRHDLILTVLPVAHERMSVLPLLRERLEVAIPTGHRLAQRERLERNDLEGETVLSIGEKHPFHLHTVKICREAGARLRRDLTGNSLDSLRYMVAMGLGIAFLPELYLRSKTDLAKEIHIARIAGQPRRTTHALAWHPDSPRAQLAGHVARQIQREVARNVRNEAD